MAKKRTKPSKSRRVLSNTSRRQTLYGRQDKNATDAWSATLGFRARSVPPVSTLSVRSRRLGAKGPLPTVSGLRKSPSRPYRPLHAFHVGPDVRVCVDRKVRREVLFAVQPDIFRSGAGMLKRKAPPRYTNKSKARC